MDAQVRGSPRQSLLHSLAKNDAIFEAIHEVVPNAAPCHPFDPLSKLLLPLVVILLG